MFFCRDEGNDTVQFSLLNSKVNNKVKISQQWPKLEHNVDFTTSTPKFNIVKTE